MNEADLARPVVQIKDLEDENQYMRYIHTEKKLL